MRKVPSEVFSGSKSSSVPSLLISVFTTSRFPCNWSLRSLHLPIHSRSPQGFRTRSSRCLPLEAFGFSTARTSISPYACRARSPVISPSTTTSLSTPSASIEHPIRLLSSRSFFSLLQSSSACVSVPLLSHPPLPLTLIFSATCPVRSTSPSSMSPPFKLS